MKTFLNCILKFFAILRRIFEPITWLLFKPRNWKKLKDLDNWDEVKNLSPEDFSDLINSEKYPYRWDKAKGLLDNVNPVGKPQYFFKDLSTDRDCDNWARVWVAYYKNHNKLIQEWIVTSKKNPFKKAHLVAVVKEDGGWRLLNYYRYREAHNTPEEAIADISSWNSGAYNEEDRLQCLYRKYKVRS